MKGYQRWNDDLVRAVFQRQKDGSSVIRIVATNQLLLAAAGSLFQYPNEARASLMEAFRLDKRGRTFQTTYRDSIHDWSPQSPHPPPFFADLFVTCLLASDDNAVDHLHDESAYRVRLNQACGNGLENDTRTLPEMWTRIQEWLEERQKAGHPYHSLILPAQRSGWRNIGYSLDLAFPTIRDREHLTEILTDNQLLGTEPRVAEVTRLLGRARSRFNRHFRDLLDDFTRQNDIGIARWTHPLWHAVIDICSDQPHQEPVSPLRLVAIQGDEHLIPFAVIGSKSRADKLRLKANAYPHNSELGDVYWLSDNDGSTSAAVSWLLSCKAEASELQCYADNGLVPFAPIGDASSGMLEAVKGNRAAAAQAFLIHREHWPRLQSLFQSSRSGFDVQCDESAIPEFLEVRDARLLPSAHDVLSTVVLRESPFSRPRINLIGGLRIDGAYLGHRQLLPSVVAPHAARVRFIGRETESFELERDDNGVFRFPVGRDVIGDLTLRLEGCAASETIERSIVFRMTPHASRICPWTDATRDLHVEGALRSHASLSESEVERKPPHDFWESCANVVYLGPAVGQISTNFASGFSFALHRDLNEHLVLLTDTSVALRPIKAKGADKGTCRRWKNVFKAPWIAPSQEARTLHAEYVRLANTGVHLPTIDTPCDVWPIPTPTGQPPSELARRLQDALSVIYSTTNRIATNRFITLLDDYLGLKTSPFTARTVGRAWEEAGVVERCWDSRWSSTFVVARPPHLAVYRLRNAVCGALMGLWSQGTLERVERAALQIGAQVILRGTTSGVSPCVPLVVARSVPELDEVASLAEIEDSRALPEFLNWPSIATVMSNEREDAPEVIASRSWFAFDQRGFGPHRVDSQPVQLERVFHPRTPTRYVVRRNNVPFYVTQSRTWAELVAHRERGACPFIVDGQQLHSATAVPSFLPLPLGRCLAAVGPVAPGPTVRQTSRTVGYSYTFSTIHLARQIFERFWGSETKQGG